MGDAPQRIMLFVSFSFGLVFLPSPLSVLSCPPCWFRFFSFPSSAPVVLVEREAGRNVSQVGRGGNELTRAFSSSSSSSSFPPLCLCLPLLSPCPSLLSFLFLAQASLLPVVFLRSFRLAGCRRPFLRSSAFPSVRRGRCRSRCDLGCRRRQAGRHTHKRRAPRGGGTGNGERETENGVASLGGEGEGEGEGPASPGDKGWSAVPFHHPIPSTIINQQAWPNCDACGPSLVGHLSVRPSVRGLEVGARGNLRDTHPKLV